MTSQVKIITSGEEFATLEKAWNELLSASPANNYFLRWEWLWNWWQVYSKKEDELRIIIIEKEDGIVGIAPFYTRKRLLGRIFPVRRMMFLGTQEEGKGDVCSDYMDVIFKNGEEEEMIRIIFETIMEHDLCDEMFLSKMDTSSSTFSLIQKKANVFGFQTIIANEFDSPYISLPSKWDDYLNSLSGSMRSKIRTERKKIENLKNIALNKIERYSELEKGYEQLIQLHQGRWESKDIQGAFSNEKFKLFHRKMLPLMMENGHLEFVILSVESCSKAAIYNIQYKNKTYFYQSGIDTRSPKIAFGYVLHSHCIEEAIKQGRKEYDFLPKGKSDHYKDRFARQFRKMADLYLVHHWIVKKYVKAEESARMVYRQVKPYLLIQKRNHGS